MSRRRGRVRVSVGVTVLALVGAALTGCAGPGAGGHGASSAPGASGQAWDVNETPYDRVADGGTFVGAYGRPLTTWNAFSVAGNDAEVQFLLSPLGSGANAEWYNIDGAGRATPNPDYVSSADASQDGGRMTVRLVMNPSAQWNDGAPITAADWAATWKALNGSDPAFTAASSDGWDQVASVVAGANDREVDFTFRQAYPDWVSLLVGGPLRAASCADPATFNEGWSDYHDGWFGGPFAVTSVDRSSGTITMERNPRWWGAPPKLDRLVWKLASPEQRGVAFANREIDYFDAAADPGAYQQAKSTPDSVIRQSFGPTFRQFTFNSKSPLLSDLTVRRAIVLGLDRTSIAASDLAGLPVTPTPLNNNLVMVDQAGYEDEAEATGLGYNPPEAERLLDDDGWRLNQATGIREKDGRPLSIGFSVVTGVGTSENEGLQARDQLRRIGIDLRLEPLDPTTDWPDVLVQHRFDIIGFSWVGTPFPYANIGQIYATGGSANYAQLTIPEVDRLRPVIDAELDPVARQDLGRQVARAIWENVHTLPLYQRPSVIAERRGLANIGAFGLARGPATWVAVGYVAG